MRCCLYDFNIFLSIMSFQNLQSKYLESKVKYKTLLKTLISCNFVSNDHIDQIDYSALDSCLRRSDDAHHHSIQARLGVICFILDNIVHCLKSFDSLFKFFISNRTNT